MGYSPARKARDIAMNPRKWPLGKAEPPRFQRIEELSQLHNKEMDLLHHLATGLPVGNIANLGHAEGGSVIIMAWALRNKEGGGSIESVDTFMDRGQWRRVRRNLVRLGVRDLVELRRGTTVEWGDKFTKRKERFAGVFVDADHSYDGVSRDSECWRRLLMVGGWIAFHDTNQDFSHVAIENTIVKDKRFEEDKTLHTWSIRVFRRIEQ